MSQTTKRQRSKPRRPANFADPRGRWATAPGLRASVCTPAGRRSFRAARSPAPRSAPLWPAHGAFRRPRRPVFSPAGTSTPRTLRLTSRRIPSITEDEPGTSGPHTVHASTPRETGDGRVFNSWPKAMRFVVQDNWPSENRRRRTDPPARLTVPGFHRNRRKTDRRRPSIEDESLLEAQSGHGRGPCPLFYVLRLAGMTRAIRLPHRKRGLPRGTSPHCGETPGSHECAHDGAKAMPHRPWPPRQVADPTGPRGSASTGPSRCTR